MSFVGRAVSTLDSRLLGTVLALERLVRHAGAPLLDTVGTLRLEAVLGLSFCVSASVLRAALVDLVGSAPAGWLWAAWLRWCEAVLGLSAAVGAGEDGDVRSSRWAFPGETAFFSANGGRRFVSAMLACFL